MDRAQAPESPPRVRALLASNWFRVLVVVLAAAVFFGAWAFAEWGRDESPQDDAIVLTLDDEYDRARRAAEAGDTDEAIEILERILAENPDDERAAALLRQLQQSQADPDDGTAQPGGASGPGSGDPADDPSDPGDDPTEPRPIGDSVLLAPVGDLDSLLPQVIAGWERGEPVASESNATVSFSPAAPGPVTRALYSVNDRGSVDGALAFIEDTSKVVYASDFGAVAIGRQEGYFGTDGARLATAVFARGRFVFEVVVTVPDGTPASARDTTIVLAREFEASR